MREFIILGRPNSGKTLFTLNFAAYNGSKFVDLTLQTYDGITTCQHFSMEEAKRQLCNMAIHKTRSLQSLLLTMAHGKTVIQFKITDTCGITEAIHSNEMIRRGMAQTLSLLRSADYIFHMIDASAISDKDNSSLTTIDHEIYNYGIIHNCYTILANKTDLPLAKNNLSNLTTLFPKTTIIPISALYSQGFKEVKACVARNI